jgi:hypothetical protein
MSQVLIVFQKGEKEFISDFDIEVSDEWYHKRNPSTTELYDFEPMCAREESCRVCDEDKNNICPFSKCDTIGEEW